MATFIRALPAVGLVLALLVGSAPVVSGQPGDDLSAGAEGASASLPAPASSEAPMAAISRVSVSSVGAQGNANSLLPGISGDGRIVTFDSRATTLAGPCFSGGRAIFVHDRSTATTTCVSVAGVTQGNGDSFNPQISTDGRFVVFYSQASNLVALDTNGLSDTFVLDRNTQVISRVSISTGGAQANGNSGLDADGFKFTSPAVSSDGRFVAFLSLASNLAANCATGDEQIFVRDRTLATTECVSVGPGGKSNGTKLNEPKISADGRFVAFRTTATNLGECSGNPLLPDTHVFLRDRTAGTTSCISVSTAGTPGNGESLEPRLNADGTIVAFQSNSTDLASPCTNGFDQIYIRNRTASTTTCISTNAGVAGNNLSREPYLSADGRFVLYSSFATNLAASCNNGQSQIHVHDRVTGVTQCVTVGIDGLAGNDFSGYPKMSADARFAAFYSRASNLVPGDTNAVFDVFVASLDGLDIPPVFRGGVYVAAGDINGDGRADIITGPGPGGGPHIKVFSGANPATLLASFFAYSPAFAGGVRVAAGDINLDGRADIITGPGPGGGPHVRVFSGANPAIELASFFAYNPAFAGGVYVAAGDVNADGRADIITGPGPGGGPHVRVFSGANPAVELASFFAYSAAFTGGVRVAAADVNGDGRADIITAAGPGGGPHIRVFSGANPAIQLASFFAYSAAFTGGVYVAAGNVTGTASPEIVTAADAGGGPHVRVFTGTGADTGISFFAYPGTFAGGVRVAVGNVDAVGTAEIITGPGPGGGPHVLIFSGSGVATGPGFFAY